MTGETLGARIRRLRAAAGLTQEEVARRARTPVATLRNWESDRRQPLADAIVALAGALGVTTDELLGVVPSAETPAATQATPPPAEEPPPAQKKPRKRKPPKPRGS